MTNSDPNLRVLKRSRVAPRVGDIFTLSPQAGLYLFGRVIATDAAIGPIQPMNLLYLYDSRGPTPEAFDPRDLTPARLLFPPVITNRLPWSRGYFVTVGHADLAPADVLPVHCFRDLDGRYYNEYSRLLPGPSQPVGFFGLDSFRTIDDYVSEALGIAPAPD